MRHWPWQAARCPTAMPRRRASLRGHTLQVWIPLKLLQSVSSCTQRFWHHWYTLAHGHPEFGLCGLSRPLPFGLEEGCMPPGP